MAQLIIYISPKDEEISRCEYLNKKTPKKRQSRSMRVINIAQYNDDVNYGQLALDLCRDSRDAYWGHVLIRTDDEVGGVEPI